MVHVIATVQLNPDSLEKFLAEFRLVRPKVLAENGCLEYGAAVDVPTAMSPQRTDTASIVEKWSSLEALQAHLGAAHMIEYRQKIRPYVQRVSLQVLRPVE